jgi:hypothetical protein
LDATVSIHGTVAEKQKALQLVHSRLNAGDSALLSNDALHMILIDSKDLVQRGGNDAALSSASRKERAWGKICKFTHNQIPQFQILVVHLSRKGEGGERWVSVVIFG